jgi:cholesterol oxidase
MTKKRSSGFDYDWLIVGSGFGGSVSALRLSEKGYRVGVLECGRRFKDEDYAKSTWNLRRYLWAPFFGLRGILRMTLFKDIFIFSGAGVGGGSVVYANTLYRAKKEYFENEQWKDLEDWQSTLSHFYDVAEKMLGVIIVPYENPSDGMLKDVAKHFGTEDTFQRTPVAVFFGEEGIEVEDPYFDGQGPKRTGCTKCGACMVGCRVGAKNTLLKNYLWFAEKNNAEIHAERKVVDIQPLGAADGSDGYRVTTERPGAWLNKKYQIFTTRGLVMSAGALGTNTLLAACKNRGSLPNISEQLGELVRTNSESILAVTLPDDSIPVWNTVAIGASIHVDADTHIEFVTYGEKGDFMGYIFTLLTGAGTKITRPLIWLGNILRHPIQFIKTLMPIGWSRRVVIFLVMQSLDNAISFKAKRKIFGKGVKLFTVQDQEKPNPTYIDIANKSAAWLADKTGGTAQSVIFEAVANIPSTAHILGGATIGRDSESGVIDKNHNVYGYRNMLICDGSAVPANPGVNPSLTITAMAERAMSKIPLKESIVKSAETLPSAS